MYLHRYKFGKTQADAEIQNFDAEILPAPQASDCLCSKQFPAEPLTFLAQSFLVLVPLEWVP